MSQIFTVFGATGQQGGALIQYLLHHPVYSKTYKLRGITRDTSKTSARALAEQGVEIIQADINDAESLKLATKGSNAVFAVTNYWEKAEAAIEVTQGKALADAAVEAGASLLIWSSLPRIGIPHFDSKADVEDYIRTLPIKSVFFMPGWFMQNYLHVVKPKKADNGTYVLSKPWPTATSATLVPLIDIADTGKYIEPFLADPDAFNGAVLTASTAFYTIKEICETWSKVTGKKVVFDETDEAGGEGRGGEGRDTLASIDVDESPYYGLGGRKRLDWTLSHVKEGLGTWEVFVEQHEPWFVD